MVLENENDDEERDQDIVSAKNTRCNKMEEDSISNHFHCLFRSLVYGPEFGNQIRPMMLQKRD